MTANRAEEPRAEEPRAEEPRAEEPRADGPRAEEPGFPVPGVDPPVTAVADLRVVVDRIEGRSVCGLSVGDSFCVTGSSRLTLPDGGHFCLYALAAVLPLLPAKQRATDPGDWMSRDAEVACPDPEERLIMRIERGEIRAVPTDDLT